MSTFKRPHNDRLGGRAAPANILIGVHATEDKRTSDIGLVAQIAIDTQNEGDKITDGQ